MKVNRVPIVSSYNRRNQYNPEFLNIDFLIQKYAPLLKSLHRYFCSYSGILDQPSDIDDLYKQIEFEFIRLAKRYDPRRGVDFSGYIKLNLRHRIFYYVIKNQSQQKSELLLLQDADSSESIEIDSLVNELYDESTEQATLRFEAINSIPWDEITSDLDKFIIMEILNHKSLEEIAKEKRMNISTIKQRFDKLCNHLINCSK